MVTARHNPATRKIEVSGSYTELNPRIKALRARHWNKARNVFELPATCLTAAELYLQFGQSLKADAETDALAKRYARAYQIKGGAPVESYSANTIHKPFNHQRAGFGLMASADAVFLRYDMGTGKTKVGIDAVDFLELPRVLVLCPKNVVPVWADQWPVHSRYARKIIAPRGGSVAKRSAEIRRQARHAPCAVIVNYESAWREGMAEVLEGLDFDAVICDESHRISDVRTKQSKIAKTLGIKARLRACFTGTPMPRDPLSFFGQCYFLDESVFGPSYIAFKMAYAVTAKHNKHQVVGFKNQDEMRERLGLISHVILKRDVLDLPPVTDVIVTIELEERAQKIYEEVESSFRVTLLHQGDGASLASADANGKTSDVDIMSVLAELGKLHQIAGGSLKDNDGVTHSVGTEKEDALVELLEGLDPDEPFVVFCVYRADIESAHRAFERTGRASCELSGSADTFSEWKAGRAPGLVTQIRSGGLGVDMTRAAYCAFYSKGFSLADYEQARARLDRHGQTRPVTIYHLCAADTVDFRIEDALRAKAAMAANLMGSGTVGGGVAVMEKPKEIGDLVRESYL